MERTYDPRRQQGVSVFREELRNFSESDRIQFIAPANDLKVANRELGTIGSIDEDGRLNLKLDTGRAIDLDPTRHMHFDYGYAVTSHSSQGQTADRVLINVDTELGAKTCSTAAWPMSLSHAARMTRKFSRTTRRLWAKNSVATCPTRQRSSRPRCHMAPSSSLSTPTRSVRGLVWACNSKSQMTFPRSQQRSRGPAGVKAALRAPRSRSRALTPASQPRHIIQLSGECQRFLFSTQNGVDFAPASTDNG